GLVVLRKHPREHPVADGRRRRATIAGEHADARRHLLGFGSQPGERLAVGIERGYVEDRDAGPFRLVSPGLRRAAVFEFTQHPLQTEAVAALDAECARQFVFGGGAARLLEVIEDVARFGYPATARPGGVTNFE